MSRLGFKGNSNHPGDQLFMNIMNKWQDGVKLNRIYVSNVELVLL